MRRALICLLLIGSPLAPALAQVNIGIGVNLPGVQIGINLPAYPRLAPMPGHPVYYAPQLQANYFFYDGLYWVLEGDNWYSSSWYNGPWNSVRPEVIPVHVLQIPVRYYRRPPQFFRGWGAEAAPRWGEHYGPQWQERRRDWDRREGRGMQTRAPLPTYQRPYAGGRYPERDQQREMYERRYRYEPRDAQVRDILRDQHGGPPPGERRTDRPDERRGRGGDDKDHDRKDHDRRR